MIASLLRRSLRSLVAACGVTALVLAESLFMAPIASAWTETIHIDQRRVLTTLDQVVPEIQRSCQTSERVRVEVTTESGRFGETFDCVLVRNRDAMSVTHELAQAARKQNDAAAKANRLVALNQKLQLKGVATFASDGMVWALAAGDGSTCTRAQRPNEIRQQMAVANKATGETPEHWTLIEAAYVGGVCPRHLPALFKNVSRIGHPDAAVAVKRRVARALPT